MTDLNPTSAKHRLTCPICSSTFFAIFPAGFCQVCSRPVCGHCIQHDNPDHPAGSICQDCVIKLSPAGRISELETDKLLELLKDPASPDSPLVAGLLGQKQDHSFVLPLCRALTSSRIDVRREAALALGNLGSQTAVPSLLSALKDPEPAVRSRAAVSLAKLDAKEAVPSLKKMKDDPSRQAAGHAVQALGQLLGSEACSLMNEMVHHHPSNFVRCEALAVLAGLDHETALSAALECLEDPVKAVVISACKILVRLNDLEAAPKLEKTIEKARSASVRMNARAALTRLLNTTN